MQPRECGCASVGVRVWVCMGTHMRGRVRVWAPMCTRRCARAWAHMHTGMRTWVRMHACVGAWACALVGVRARGHARETPHHHHHHHHTHACTHSPHHHHHLYTHTHTTTTTRTPPPPPSHTHQPTHQLTHQPTHTCMLTHACSHMHAHTCTPIPQKHTTIHPHARAHTITTKICAECTNNIKENNYILTWEDDLNARHSCSNQTMKSKAIKVAVVTVHLKAIQIMKQNQSYKIYPLATVMQLFQHLE